MLYCIFLWGENIGILYSAIKAELCSVQFYELSVVLILVQLRWTKMHFIVNYWSSQFTSKVLSKRLLMNSICNLCWVFSEASWMTALLFLDVDAFHAYNMADPSTIWNPAKTTAIRVLWRERQDIYASSCRFTSNNINTMSFYSEATYS